MAEEGVERVVDVGVGLGGAVGVDAVFEEVEFPAGVAHLDAGLADVEG